MGQIPGTAAIRGKADGAGRQWRAGRKDPDHALTSAANTWQLFTVMLAHCGSPAQVRTCSLLMNPSLRRSARLMLRAASFRPRWKCAGCSWVSPTTCRRGNVPGPLLDGSHCRPRPQRNHGHAGPDHRCGDGRSIHVDAMQMRPLAAGRWRGTRSTA